MLLLQRLHLHLHLIALLHQLLLLLLVLTRHVMLIMLLLNLQGGLITSALHDLVDDGCAMVFWIAREKSKFSKISKAYPWFLRCCMSFVT